jgi:hypothetical protein
MSLGWNGLMWQGLRIHFVQMRIGMVWNDALILHFSVVKES